MISGLVSWYRYRYINQPLGSWAIFLWEHDSPHNSLVNQVRYCSVTLINLLPHKNNKRYRENGFIWARVDFGIHYSWAFTVDIKQLPGRLDFPTAEPTWNNLVAVINTERLLSLSLSLSRYNHLDGVRQAAFPESRCQTFLLNTEWKIGLGRSARGEDVMEQTAPGGHWRSERRNVKG